MEIRKINQPKSEWEQARTGSHIADATSVVLELQQKKVKIKKTKIKDIARGLAEVAYSMGETNNPEEFADIMAEDILEGLKLVEKEQKEKKKKKT